MQRPRTSNDVLIVFQFFRFSLSRIFAGNIIFYYEGFSSYRKPYKEYVDVCETNFSSSSACLSYGKGLILAGSYLMCCFMLRFLYLRLSGLLLIPIIGVILFLIKVFFAKLYGLCVSFSCLSCFAVF